jgi:glycerophosphoryl diester phosphodiesterase
MPDRAVRVFGHRGASAQRAENTVAAFALAAELGADWVELDVWAVDGAGLVVFHDDPAGLPLPPGVPTLAEALEACGPMGVNVEIKGAPVAEVAAVVRAWGGEVLVSSFEPAVVDEARAAGLPTAQLDYLLDRPVAELVAGVAARGHLAWHPWFPICDREAIEAAHAVGLLVNTWTVDDPARIAELASWGVDGIMTDDVPAALAALGREKPGGTASRSGD